MRTLSLMMITLVVLFSGAIAFAQDEDPPPPPPPAEEIAEGAVQITEAAAEGAITAFGNIWERLVQPPENEIARLVLLIGGAVLLIVGWRLYEFIIIISGALSGAALALALIGPQEAAITELAALLIGGVVGAILAGFLYYVAVFFIGAYVGITLTNALANALNLTEISALVLIIAAVIGGVVMLGLSMELLIIISALVGAQMVGLALNLPGEWVILLTVVSVLLQLIIIRAFRVEMRRRPRQLRLFRRRV